MAALSIHAIEEVVTGSDIVLGEILRQARLSTGMPSALAARASGLTQADVGMLEAGRLGAFASPERARLALLAYCDTICVDPATVLGRLDAYGDRQWLEVPEQRSRNAGALRAFGVALVAGLIAWQAATLYADADDRQGAGNELGSLGPR